MTNQSKSGAAANSQVTIFVVDDEQMLLDLAVAILQPLGFDVRTFRDPRMALKEFPAAKPAVIVTDYAMGEMNGLDLVRECKRVNPKQKMILCSGTVDADIYADLPLKPDRFLVKPYPIHELIETIRALAAS
jgi:DNA-binding response OmpR family regulator